MRRLHWKRLVLFLTLFFLICGTTYALNRAQVRRQAEVFKDRALAAKQAAAADPKKREDALALFEQYLKFRPKDEEAFREYTRMVLNPDELDGGKLAHMADVGSKFLRDFPENSAERRLVVKVLYNKADLNGAREHLAMLFRDPALKNDPDLLDDAIKIEEVEKKFSEALVYADRGIENVKDPARVVKFYAKALALQRAMHKDTEAALRVDALQKKPPYATRPDARVAVVRHLLATRDYPAAREHVKIALKLKEGEPDADTLLAAAEVEVAGREPQLGAARQYLERAFAADPKRVATGGLLAEVLIRQAHRDEAIAVLTQLSREITTVKDDFYNTLDKLIDLKETIVSEQMMTKLTPENTRKFVQQYFRGRLELAKGNWPVAKVELEACAPFLTGLPDYHKKLRSDLGECYSQSHNPDQMLESYRAALKDDPTYYPAQLGYAEALVKLGRFRDAIPIYTDLVREVKALHPTLARLVLLDQISRPESQRNWKAFEDSLGPLPHSTELMLLKAEALSIRGDKAAASTIISEAASKDPMNPSISLKAMKIGSAGGISSEDAERLIEEAAKKTGDSVDFRLAKVNILMSRAKRPSIAELQAIGNVPDDPKAFPKPEVHRLLFGLGDIANRINDPAMKQAALEFFRKAADLDPRDLVSRALIIDLAISLKQEAVWEKALREIGNADGLEGPIYNLGQIAIRVNSFTPGDKDTLRDLRKRAEGIQKKRPSWSRAYLALAQLDELEGLNDSALQNLRKAIDLGDKQEAVIRRAVDLLRERKMYEDAAVLLNKLDSELVLPTDLQRFRAIMNLLTSDVLKQTTDGINRFAPEDAPTYEMQLLRGTLLAALREEAGAEKAFRKALEKVPTERPGAAPLEAWSSLVVLLVRTDKRDIARQAVEEAERKLKTTPAKVENLLTLGGINEAVGDLAAAEKYFQQIANIAPNELDGHKQLVMFLQRNGKMPEAEVMLRSLITNPAQSIARWARRHLAITLMMKRDAFQNLGTALSLTEQNLRDSKDDPDDRKAYAIVLCADPARRGEGTQILAEYGRKFELSSDEYYFLTRVYFDQGRFHDATETLKLAIRHRPNVAIEHLAGAVSLYLAMGDVGKAKETADRLMLVAPKSWEATREMARVLARTGNTSDARDLILKHPYALTDAFIPAHTGPLLDEIKCYPDVEQLYKKFRDSAKAQGRHLPYAMFLISQKRTDEAIDEAKKYEAEAHPVVTGRIFSSAVRSKMPTPDKVAAVETWLNKKLVEHQNKQDVYAALVGAIAEVRDAQGRYDEAIAEYEKALRLNDSDLLRNNLAMLLALHKPSRANEAKAMMDKLIGIRGPEPTFLDTRAVCSLVQGENAPTQAVKDLTLALAQRQRAVFYFHLAWAYDLQRLEQDKKVALLKATQLGLTRDDIHPKEMEKYNEFYGRRSQ